MAVNWPALLINLSWNETDRRSDLHGGNLLLRHPSLSSKSVEELYQRIGKPRRLPVTRFDDQPLKSEAPRYCVAPAGIRITSDKVTDPDLVIADFGGAFMCEADRRTDVELRTPVLLLPPEAIFNEGFNQAADTWTAANTLYEILGEGSLFEVWPVNKDGVVADMISTLGLETFPKHWWNRWGAQRRYFHPDGNWVQHPERKYVVDYLPLAERVRVMRERDGGGGFSSHELDTVKSLLSRMLMYNPAGRITAKEALKSEWMTQCGLPAIASPDAGPPVL
jgi:serine/threonine protein kinase